jgi:2',3'-cyclic-nucleotide 2'-phosphodiesterase (5'-nucleotidase family)
MKKNLSVVLIIFLSGCISTFTLKDFESESIKVDNSIDSTIYKIILPYQAKIDFQMDRVLCYTKNDLIKGMPEGNLGNLICDLSLETSKQKADMCIMNNGGLRSIILKGQITERDIFKVMPFENELVVLNLHKDEFYQMLKYVTKRGGEPLGGIKVVQSKDTIRYTLNNKVSIYKDSISVLTTDYLANGGDKMNFFKNKVQKKLNIKLRDAIINYCKKQDTLNIILDQRIIINE